MGDRTTELAGELADGVIFSQMPAERVRAAVPPLRTGRQRAGREGLGEVVVFLAVEGELDAGPMASQVAAMVQAGATHVVLHALDTALGRSGAPELEDVARFVAHDLRPLVG